MKYSTETVPLKSILVISFQYYRNGETSSYLWFPGTYNPIIIKERIQFVTLISKAFNTIQYNFRISYIYTLSGLNSFKQCSNMVLY